MRSLWLIGSLGLAILDCGCVERAGTAATNPAMDTRRDSANLSHGEPVPTPSSALRPVLREVAYSEPTAVSGADAGVEPAGSVPSQTIQKITPEPGYPNDDPSDDHVVGPPDVIEDCDERLTAAKVTYRHAKLPVHRSRDLVCGTEQAVIYVRGPSGLRIQPQPVVSCGLALALARFEEVLERTAHEFFGSRVVTVTQGGTYSCRSMARFRWVSEHSYANAIDLYEFSLANGRRVNVLRDFGSPRASATTVEGKFLRELAHRAYDERVFSVVVTRFFDELHRNHIHVDMARYRTDGSR